MNALTRVSVFVLMGVIAVPLPVAAQWPFGAAAGVALAGDNAGRSVSEGGFLVTGGDRVGVHLRGIADYAIGASPLSVRAEALFNSLSSRAQSFSVLRGVVARNALRDRTAAGTVGLVLATSRQAAFAPYVIGGGGLYHTWLGTNPDPLSPAVTETRTHLGAGLNIGAGLRMRTGRAAVLVELRYHRMLGQGAGSPFVPLTAGLVF